jgi:hypothetical protein
MKLCNTECDGFSYDPGVIVNTKGRFKSDGERALAFAIAANVRSIQPGTTLQSTSFVGVTWFNETKSKNQNTHVPLMFLRSPTHPHILFFLSLSLLLLLLLPQSLVLFHSSLFFFCRRIIKKNQLESPTVEMSFMNAMQKLALLCRCCS